MIFKLLKFLREQSIVFDIISKELAATRPRPWKGLDRIYKLIPEGSLVMDLGCGGGRDTVYLASLGHFVISLDFSYKLLKITHKRVLDHKLFRKVNLIQASITHLPFREGIADVCVSIATLHHVPTFKLRLKVLSEIKRVLKKGGILILTVWSLFQPRHIRPVLLSFFSTYRRIWEFGDAYVPWRRGVKVPVERFYHLYTPLELKISLRISGYIKVIIKRFNIAKKPYPQNYIAISIK